MAITRAKVHAALRKAGLRKTTTHTTRIRGWHDRVQGYHVGEDESSVYVEELGIPHFLSNEEKLLREDTAMEKFCAALAAFSPEVTMTRWGKKRCAIQKENK